MNPSELVSNLRTLGNQELHIFLNYLADHWHELRLQSGGRLLDGSDAKEFLREAAEYAMPAREFSSPVEFGNHKLRASGRVIDSTCPRCGHIHQGEQECGTQMGRDRLCRCDLEVPA